MLAKFGSKLKFPPVSPYGEGFGTETNLLGRGRVPEFLSVLVVFACFLWAPGRFSCPPGPILESVLLWLWFASVDGHLPVLVEGRVASSFVPGHDTA